MSDLAVIPARGGSKRIPRKNIRAFAGEPMIAWSIRAALDSGCFSAVIVSTDDAEIAAVARSFGAQTPFLRPPELSDDQATTIPVIAHAALWAREAGLNPRNLCCLYATAPFVRPEDLRAGLALLEGEAAPDYVFAAASFAAPIQRAFLLTPEGGVKMLQPEHRETRSQDLPEAFHDAGQFYWGGAESWVSRRPIFSPRARAVVLPRHRVQDIDDLEDWRRAELMFEALRRTEA